MGQQQLLLLVLSTVIVGLATVAGIQAFSENQEQATEDALVQRAINIGNDVLAAHNEPSQFGGTNLNDSNEDASSVATAAGYSTDSEIDAAGAGDNAGCDITITTGSDGTATVECGSEGATSGEQTVVVTVDPDASSDKVSTTTINGNSV